MKSAGNLLVLLAVAALAASGCGDSSSPTATPEVDRSQLDSAYEAVAAAQFDNAIGYSNAILKTTSDPDIKRFAESVLLQREVWSATLNKSQTEDLAEASDTLGISPKSLGITADGSPLAAPSSDTGYLSAMKLNLKASLRAAEVAKSQLAGQVIRGATKELAEIEQLQN